MWKCEEYLLMDSDYIAHHLRSGAKTNPHDITHANYNEKYMTLQCISKNPFGKKIKKEPANNLETEMFKNDSESKYLDTTAKALNEEIDVLDSSNCGDNNSNDTENVTVESFRKFLNSLSIDGEEIRFPALESLLNMNI